MCSLWALSHSLFCRARPANSRLAKPSLSVPDHGGAHLVFRHAVGESSNQDHIRQVVLPSAAPEGDRRAVPNKVPGSQLVLDDARATARGQAKTPGGGPGGK